MCGDTHTNFPSVSQGKNNSLSTNNRGGEVQPAADDEAYVLQVRAEFLARHAGPNAPEFYNMLWSVMLNPNLLPVEKNIYVLCLAERHGFEWSVRRIAALAGVSEPTVKRAFRALEREGAIVRKRRFKQTTAATFEHAPLEEEVAKLAEEIRSRQPEKVDKKKQPEPAFRSPVILRTDHPRSTTSDIYTSEKKDKRASNTQYGSIVGMPPSASILVVGPRLRVMQ